jgi:hypothetical protein
MSTLATAIIGAQFPSSSPPPPLAAQHAALKTIQHFMCRGPGATRPAHTETCAVTDKRGALNVAVVAYWGSAAAYDEWAVASGFRAWWESSEREGRAEGGHGWFCEVLTPGVERFETVFSNDGCVEGAANLQVGISGEVREHAYWGSMRDRLAVAQEDGLEGHKMGGRSEMDARVGERVRVPGRKNLCVIRSGQDWSDTLPAERALYLDTMHPVLIKGMDFLRDQGQEVGCYAMNLWNVVDSETLEASRERTFGLGFFDELASLEKWSKSHPTHVNIFGGFLMYAKKLDNVLSLRLFHEVYILRKDQQFFEYIGCHGETGMLTALGCGVEAC